MMASSKGRPNVSQDNSLRPTLESLSTDEQQEFEHLMKQWDEKALRQHNRVLEEAKEKFLSHSTDGRHQKITKQG